MQNEHSEVTGRSKQRMLLFCLFVTVLIDQAGLVLIAPIIPALLESITSQGAAENTQVAGWLIAAYGLMQFIFAPIMGALSDRFGRRRVLLACFLAFAIDYVIFALADSVLLLLLGRIIAGITGSSMVVSLASVADISTPEKKTRNFAYMYAAIGMGMILGPAVSSLTVDFGLRVPFLVAAGLSACSLLLIYFFFSETLPPERRRAFVLKNPLASVNRFRRYPGLGYLFLCHFCILLAFQAPVVLWAFFTKYRFDWNEQQIANSLVLIGVMMVFVQTVLVRYTYAWLGNKGSCYVGYTMFGAGMVLISMSVYPWLFLLALIPYSLGSISNSAMSSIYSSAVSPSEQGEIQGALVSISSVAFTVGPVVVSYLYSAGVESGVRLGDGLPFLVGAVLTLASALLFRRGLARVASQQPVGLVPAPGLSAGELK